MYLDLSELDQVCSSRWLWSAARPAVCRFRRDDHFGPPNQPLDQSVRELVESSTGESPAGPIRLLTHLRTFGYVINPISLFYCFDADDQRVQAIVAEVKNTPWGERHCYVIDRARATVSGRQWRYRNDKELHVSPFFPMEMEYRWQLTMPGANLAVHLENFAQAEKQFDATLLLKRREITTASLTRVLCRYPFLTGQVAAAIYWQALRLWWKQCPFFPHPRTRSTTQPEPR